MKLDNHIIKLFSGWDRQQTTFLRSFLDKNKYEAIFIFSDEFFSTTQLPLLKTVFGARLPLFSFCLKSGEDIKNLEQAEVIYDEMFALNLNRKTLFVNFGGGTISDLGGFVASTYKRGLDFINLPTSLLAMVDASIGGKVGVNFNKNKNGLGLFVEPKLVLINVEYLETLPKEEFLSGWGELVKHGLIHDEAFFNLVLSKSPMEFTQQELVEIISRSLEIKNYYVKDDRFDDGARQLLNFGHTIGHALEVYYSVAKDTKHSLKHGEAVLWGCLIESLISKLMGVLSDKKYLEIKNKILSLDLMSLELAKIDLKELELLLKKDKKNRGDEIIFNLIKDIGQVEWGQSLDLSVMKRAFNQFDNKLGKAQT